MGKRRPKRSKAADNVQRPMIEARNNSQRSLIESIIRNDITFGIGPAGTGKTFVSASLACDALDSGEAERIVICRPLQEAAGEQLGFLPGTLEEKCDPYLRPLLTVMERFFKFDAGRFQTLVDKQRIEIVPLAFMRGRSFENCWIICDEAQNMAEEDVFMLMTRLGENSKMIILGDPEQRDRKNAKGLEAASVILGNCKDIGFTQFNNGDVVRHETVKRILTLWSRAKAKRQRPDPAPTSQIAA